jgi:hypothetical protein
MRLLQQNLFSSDAARFNALETLGEFFCFTVASAELYFTRARHLLDAYLFCIFLRQDIRWEV